MDTFSAGYRIQGKEMARDIIVRLAARTKPDRFLAAFVVGDNLVSLNFLKKKEEVAEALGVEFRLYQLPEHAAAEAVRREIEDVQREPRCGGVLVQLPLASHLGSHALLNSIDAAKDVDVLGERARGAFYNGDSLVVPPALSVIEEICNDRKLVLERMRVAVVGVGFLIGKPVATWLQGRVKELTILTRKSDLLSSTCGIRNADLVITGTGSPGLIHAHMVKEGAGVIDFGTSMVEGKLRGDLYAEPEEMKRLAFYTPTPGGTGPILVAKLFENFYTLSESQ
ncbi:MAG: bifunctional 5,10-methylenetetrahydrofolate dehydrogenase/5,10-methenyltetrahydrofolate cyclohydrolase [Patescibacteria group bacterium]|nr:bifunctional 5,10-methylenetetrahydrofolate dehydrogenase/5,10-methenyltetrahydrofolate cyclohydrolase [Patescibacteria group bacterium]MDE2438319.1 bifunctional 5,10-methylenetetrahydrofolate dehydrogenase/5,10-methenyltetrahydrofolate cyclohydrolase [Patescibacteria group bacterium]